MATGSETGFESGSYYGEVVDIGLLVTILEEVTPIDIRGHQGGTKTGALVWINNNAIFREKMTNYTRGFPYIWCTLAYTVTFESNWQRAEEILRDIVEGHDEIITTAKLARKRLSEVASDFAIKVDNTAPRVSHLDGRQRDRAAAAIHGSPTPSPRPHR